MSKTWIPSATRRAVFPDLQLDHVIPVDAGGSNTADNVVLACRSCNASKRNRDVSGWLEERRVD